MAKHQSRKWAALFLSAVLTISQLSTVVYAEAGGADSPSGGFEAAETDSLLGGGFTEADPDALETETDETETSKGFSDVTEEMPELLTGTENGVTYLDANGVKRRQDNVTVAQPSGSRIPSSFSDGWYVLRGSGKESESTGVINGDVYLILEDGCSYEYAKGLQVNNESSLTIYAQSTDESTMGKLTATGNVDAGIGEIEGSDGAGNITINGGYIEATGNNGAGIGGRNGAGNIIINGGIIVANGTNGGAGIGNGYEGSLGGSITITGGKVTATGGQGAAGIGGGENSYNTDNSSFEIKITGGEVTATGGSNGGAGIGGGLNRSSGECNINITITGGTVWAVGGGFGGAGIGGAYNTPGKATVTISGGMVTAIGGDGYGDGIGNGYPTSKDIITGPKYKVDVTFSTTGENNEPGNAVIVATGGGNSAGDETKGIDAVNEEDEETGRGSWSGIIFEKANSNSDPGNKEITGSIYGNPTFKKDFTIPENCVLTIGSDKTLTVPEDVTMTNNGTIKVEGGTLTNEGTIENHGTISEGVTGDVREESEVSVKITGDSVTKEGDGTYSASYAKTVTITATISEKPETEKIINLLTAGKAAENQVVFTVTDRTTSWELDTVNELTKTDDGYTASVTTTLGDLSDPSQSKWEADATYTITADFGGKAGTDGTTEGTGEQGLIAGKGTATLTVDRLDREGSPEGGKIVVVTFSATTIEFDSDAFSDEDPVEYGYATSTNGNITWQSGNTITGLQPATCYYLYVRYAPDEIYNASGPSDCIHYWTKYADPVPGEDYTIDYENETITIKDGYEVNTTEIFDGTSIPNGASLSDYTGQRLYIRHIGVLNGAPASAAIPFKLAERPDAPSGLSPVSETLYGRNDGKITGTTADMEYRLTSEQTWKGCSETETTGLAPGTYEVRFKSTTDKFAGEPALVTIDSGSVPVYYYTITASAGQGGTISPSGSVSVREGTDKTFTITPDSGYVISDVRVDGESVGAVSSYTFDNVRKRHTIEAVFEEAAPEVPEVSAAVLWVDDRSTNSVTIAWDKVEEAEGYTIWFRSEYDDTVSRHIIWSGDTTSWTHKGLQPGTKYFYKIRAWVTDENGKYIFSDIEEARTQRGTTKPEAARIIGVTVTGGKIKVRLEGEAAGAERYSMCYGDSRGCFKENDFQVGIRTSYTVRTLTPEFAEGTYYVCVKSYRNLGNNKRVYGEWSNTFRAVVK